LSSSAALGRAAAGDWRAFDLQSLDDGGWRNWDNRRERIRRRPLRDHGPDGGQPADTTNALFPDTRSLDYRRVPLPSAADLAVIHWAWRTTWSGVTTTRDARSEEAARRLGVRQLRDVVAADVARVEVARATRRRARHVITEDERVLQSVAAMDAGIAAGWAIFAASHVSMRDDFEVSVLK
jgi:galactokinase